ncbi:MAG: PAS domain S-box protein [Chloroflexi bacterium]|nr:PAS domain S-box protein [Chloroflexota bacterium]
MGKPFAEVTHPDDLPVVIERHQRRLKGEVIPGMNNYRVVRKDGQVIWIELSAVTIEWEGRPATLNFVSDVTARLQAEEALRRSEEKYSTILEEMDEAYYELDTKGNYTFFNDVVCHQSGYSREELLGLNYKAYTPPEERRRIVEAYSSVFNTGIPRRWFPMSNIRKDGSRIYLEDSIYPLRNQKGEIIGLRGLSRDVTDRVKAEKDIQRRAALLDSAYDSIIAYDLDGKIIYANQTSCSIRGFSLDEMLAMNMRQLVPIEELPGLEERHRQLLEKGELSSEAIHIRKDGSTFIVDTHLRLAGLAGDKLVIAVQRDITLRKQMENQIVQSEAKYRSIVDTSASGIAIADEAGTLIFVNDRLCDMYGYSRDEVLGKQFLDFIHPDERERIARDFFEAVISSKTLPTLEFRGVRKDGSTIWLFTTPNPLKTGDHLTGFSVVIQDITQLKLAETALKGSEQRYRSLFQHNPAMVYALDRQGNYTSVNAAALRISGYSEEDIGKMGFADVMAAEYLETVKRNYARALNGEPQSYEAVMIAKDGRRIDIHITSTPIIVDGQIIGVYGIAEDITGRKQLEKLLIESETKYRTVVENMHDVLYRTNNEGIITLVSPAITRMLGVESVEQVIGKNLARDIYANPGERARILELIKAKGEVVDLEVNLRRADGQIITVAANSHIYRDANGQPAGIEGVIRDITERKKAEEELRSALERLGSSLESIIDAIAMMSELRDPYTAGHQRRVTHLALAIADELGLPDARKQPLRVAGLLHDVGKIYVPSEILSKPGKLTDLEMGLARAHAAAGYDVIAAIKFPWPIADIVVQHHERMDGSGYPAGLKGDDIVLEARIIAVADVVEAMISHRPYRPALGVDKALDEITANRGRLYDERAVDACIKLLTEKGFKFPD